MILRGLVSTYLCMQASMYIYIYVFMMYSMSTHTYMGMYSFACGILKKNIYPRWSTVVNGAPSQAVVRK